MVLVTARKPSGARVSPVFQLDCWAKKVGMVEIIEELGVEAERDQSIAMSKPPLIPMDC
jgi:hypothetical protein